MVECDVSFRIVFTGEGDLSNHAIYEIRKLIAEAWERCGFGRVIENGTDAFDNEFLGTYQDEYNENEKTLLISYNMFLNNPRGSLMQFLWDELNDLFTRIYQLEPNCHSSCECMFV